MQAYEVLVRHGLESHTCSLHAHGTCDACRFQTTPWCEPLVMIDRLASETMVNLMAASQQLTATSPRIELLQRPCSSLLLTVRALREASHLSATLR